MSSAEQPIPDANRLYIGEGVTIKGEISVPDTLVVCGSVEGDVSVGNLIVGETGAIKGRITVTENAEISGRVFEKLDVKCLLILRSSGRVDANVSYGLLQIEQGASIAGGLSSTDYRPEQRSPKVDLYNRQDPRPEARSVPQAGDLDGVGTAADAGCPASGVIKPRSGQATAGAVLSSATVATGSAASIDPTPTAPSIAVCGEVAQRSAL